MRVRLALLASSGLVLVLLGSPAYGDVVLDSSFGNAEVSVPSGTGPDGQFTNHLITEDMGQRSAPGGPNLFFSFSEFSLLTSTTSATFTSEGPVTNVLARVTGGTESRIAGILRSTIDGAALWFFNPSGVFFDTTAQLDLRGSLHVSTADVVRFDEPGTDWLTGVAGDSLLSAASPAAFGFLGESGSTISVNRSTLLLRPGETLSLVGRDGVDAVGSFEPGVEIRGFSREARKVIVSGGEIRLASVAAPIDVPVDVGSLDPSALGTGQLGTVELTSDGFLDVSGAPAGRVVIRGGHFVMDDANISAISFGAEDAPEASIDIAVAGDLFLGDPTLPAGSPAILTTAANAGGSGGGVRLEGSTVGMIRAASVTTSAFNGQGGGIEVRAGAFSMDGAGTALQTVSSGTGTAGDVAVSADDTRLSGGARIAVVSTGVAPGGDIVVSGLAQESADRVALTGAATRIRSTNADATTGVIEVSADRVSVADGAEISSTTTGVEAGAPIAIRAGDLRLNAVDGDGVPIPGTAGLVVTDAQGAGAGGAIDVEATDIRIYDRARIQTQAQASGPGGALDVSADSILVRHDSADPDVARIATLTTGTTEEAAAGDLTVAARTIDLEAGGQISTSTLGPGSTGKLSIAGRGGVVAERVTATGQADVEGELTAPSGIFNRSGDQLTPGTGRAGDIEIDAAVLEIFDGAGVSARATGSGEAGNIRVVSSERVTIDGGATGTSILTTRGLDGASGSIRIETDLIDVKGGGQVSASTAGLGDSGDVVVEAREVRVGGTSPDGDPSAIFAQTVLPAGGGDAGDVSVSAREDIRVTDGGEISVSSQGNGASGNLTLSAGREIEISRSGQVAARTERIGRPGSITVSGADVLTISEGGSLNAESIYRSVFGAPPESAGTITVRDVGAVRVATEGGIDSTAIDADAGFVDIALDVAAADGDVALDGIAPGELQVGSGGRISVSTTGQGDSGRIAISARDVLVDGSSPLGAPSSISAQTEAISGGGDGGDVTVVAKRDIQVWNGGEISVASLGDGASGNLTLVAGNEIDVSSAGQIAARSASADAGNVVIAGVTDLNLRAGKITTESETGFGGNIEITAGNQIYMQDSEIRSDVCQTCADDGPGVAGEGGDIEIDPVFVVMQRSQIKADAVGDAGNITIQANYLVLDRFSELTATSTVGVAGEIDVTSPTTELTAEINTLPSDFLSAAELLRSECAARTGRAGSFVVTGRDVAPPAPDAPISSFYPGAWDRR